MANLDKEEFFFTLTAPVQMIYPNLQTPKKAKNKQGKETGKPKYGASFCFPKDHGDVKAIVNKMGQLILHEWPGTSQEEVNGIIKNAFKSGAKVAAELRESKKSEEIAKFVEDKFVLKSSSEFAPTLGGIENNGAVDYRTDEQIALNAKKFYSGAFVGAKFKFVPMEIEEKKHMVKYLTEVFTLNRGDRIGGSRSAATTFSSYVGKHTGENPIEADADDLESILS